MFWARTLFPVQVERPFQEPDASAVLVVERPFLVSGSALAEEDLPRLTLREDAESLVATAEYLVGHRVHVSKPEDVGQVGRLHRPPVKQRQIAE